MRRASLALHKHAEIRPLADLLSPVQAELRLVQRRIDQAIVSEHAVLTEAYRALFAGGKRLRPAITLLAAGEEHAATPPVVALGAALEMLHGATLIHDDIIDGASVRRGRPTLCSVHGGDTAILAGDHLFARAAVVVTETKHFEALRVFAETLVTISSGELSQIWCRDRLPSLDEYLALIYAKTARLFESAALGGALLAGRPREHVERFARYGHYLGLAFQIADDVLDYVGDAAAMGKPTLNDLTRGHLTLPGLLCLWELPGWQERALPQPVTADHVARLVERVIAGGFVERALAMAESYADKAWQSVDGLEQGAYADSLRGFAAFATARAV